MVKQAFVSAEDQNFWTDPGVDPVAIVRAGVFDLMHIWARAAGRSAPPPSPSRWPRTCCWTTEITLARKVKEAILAMRIDHALTKQRVLETLPERDLPRPAGLWRRRRGAGVFQQAARSAHPGRGGVPGGAAEGAEQLQPVPLSRCRTRAARLGAGPHGRRPRHHRQRRRRRRRPSRSCRRNSTVRRRSRVPTGSPRRCGAS